MKTHGDWFTRIVLTFIAFIFVLVVGCYILLAVVVVKGSNKIEQNGLKYYIERVWEGSKKVDQQK